MRLTTAPWIAGVALVASATSCSHTKSAAESTAPAPAPAPADAPEIDVKNPLLAEWVGPFGGVPAFDRMDLASLEPAMKTAMASHLAEIDTIANDPAAPTFDNTIVAMERSGQDLNRLFTYWGIWRGNKSTPEARKIQTALAPKIAEFELKITQNAKLFSRVKAVHESPSTAQRSAAEQRLTKLVYDQFARTGAALDDDKQKRYAEINQRLAKLYSNFSDNVLADEESYVLYLTKDQLRGLPESLIAGAGAAAKARHHEGQYAILNTRSSMDPFLTYSDDRKLREQVWTTYYNRGDNGDAHDNNALIAEILKLRHERVGLLGYKNFAQWRLENRMAQTPTQALDLLEAVWPAAVARTKEEVVDMQALADKAGAHITIKPWDYRYYADQVRQAKYDLDSNEVKQYLQLDKLRDAMFMVAGELFAFKFTRVADGEVPVFHPDVQVWEVTQKTTAEHIGLWYLDPFARPGKRSGAWATSFRGHETFDGKRTVLSSNNSNFIKGAPGEVVLISLDDARTYFHEFGHALHSLSSAVEYPTLNGGVRDYTEFQSQLLERWLLTDKVIKGFLVHHKTGEPMPAALVAKIRKAATFNKGFSTTEYLASALMDLRYHTVDPAGLDPDAFERETLKKLLLPPEVVMRHRSPHFGHIFSGEGYAAGYYGYMWADVLTADASEAFAESPGGYYDQGWAEKLVKHLFAPRNAVDPAEAYRAFRGRDAKIGPLMRDRGFPGLSAKPE